MGLFNQANAPGFQTARESEESQVFMAGRNGFTMIVDSPAVLISSVTVDSGNTPTTTLRGGNILGQLTSGSELKLYDPDANDGTQLPVGVLEAHLDMLQQGTATDRFTSILKSAILKEGELINEDAHALAVLLHSGFRLDSLLPNGAAFLSRHRKRQLHAADYTVVAADNGDLLVATTAATFTLPTKAHGLKFQFLQTSDNTLVIASAGSADDIIAKGDATADTLTFNTSSEKIGSFVEVECIYTDTSGTLRWIAKNYGGTTMTVG